MVMRYISLINEFYSIAQPTLAWGKRLFLGRICYWHLMGRITLVFRNAFEVSSLIAQMGVFLNFAFKTPFIDCCCTECARYLSYAFSLLALKLDILFLVWMNSQVKRPFGTTRKFKQCNRPLWMWYTSKLSNLLHRYTCKLTI